MEENNIMASLVGKSRLPKLKCERKVVRRWITIEFTKDEDFSCKPVVEDKVNSLFDLDVQIKTMMEELDVSDEDYVKEIETVQEYREKALLCLHRCSSEERSVDPIKPGSEYKAVPFKLPAIQWNTFDGRVENWIKFWSQFGKMSICC